MQKKEAKMTNKKENELKRVIGQYKRSSNQKSAQIRFYKLQFKAIKERIEKILELEKPMGHHNFDFTRKKE